MNKWRLLRSEQAITSKWLTVTKNSYALPTGAELSDYYVLERSDFVLVVATDDKRLILVRQYRPATGHTYVSLPAGYIGEHEDPLVAAARELMEETGVSAAECSLVGELHPLPGYIKSAAYVVVARGLSGEIATKDKDEIDSAFGCSWQEALAMIRSGEIREMQAVSALLLVREILAAETSAQEPNV